MNWVILSYVVVAIAVFMSIKIVQLQPVFETVQVNPPTIVYERLNSLPPQQLSAVLNISKSLNFTVEQLPNGNWTVYPKFNVTVSPTNG